VHQILAPQNLTIFHLLPSQWELQSYGQINDNTAQTVTEGNPSGTTPPNGFDSGILAPGKTFTPNFDRVGATQYYCTLHPTMLGEIITK